MQISARSDYAVKAMIGAALHAGEGFISSARLAEGQNIPQSFIPTILADLRRGGLLTSQRGFVGGYVLARPAAEISVGDILRTIQGSLTTVRGLSLDDVDYRADANANLTTLWQSVEDSIAAVVDRVTLADLVAARESCRD
ncbi:AsnC family transcriptional regulator [Asanoa ishikariensis]|uniref:Transcriptional regulator, BadM/Rrf2 family n=1 Tax=Asanoa ishikariensis TaxID=137265 RepID=A0A1H3UJI9_9ACTN|nr:Rrf2 family transcriptional regulator [Asanoa ishikariensis]GIF63344.1 AsnC family transcriptional regulator [Asanoa ishikariensis]SDZ62544.1 transcriptional regulator, BadM/Rrf2 family [Asanoa ishikariensis]